MIGDEDGDDEKDEILTGGLCFKLLLLVPSDRPVFIVVVAVVGLLVLSIVDGECFGCLE